MKANRLVMTLLVGDDEDIIRYNIDFHLKKGVDFIIATTFISTKDNTRNILREYERQGSLHFMDEIGGDYNKTNWVGHMGRFAWERYGADIVFHCAADEFWFPRSGNLKNEISRRSEDALNVDVTNVLLQKRNGNERFPEDSRYAVVGPMVIQNYEKDAANDNPYFYRYPSKMIFKKWKMFLEASQGGHLFANQEDAVYVGKSQDITIYHYPVRSKRQFFNKVILEGSLCEQNEEFGKDLSSHMRRWYDCYMKGLLEEEFEKIIIHEQVIDDLVREGVIEEHDFNHIILGNEERAAQWRFFYRKFEYEEVMGFLDTGWHGHIFFAYDLVRNCRPARIVELGTAKGHSFFSICQAVKDGGLDTELFAVDTWQGDKHAGFYDDSVWDNVNRIKKAFYDSLQISLLRKKFDEAVDDFEEKSIDVLHIDGCHTYEAAKNDFERWIGKVKDNGIVLLHDINERMDDFGVYKLWDELKKQYDTMEFYHSHGLGVLCKNAKGFSDIFSFNRIWQDYYSIRMDNGLLVISNQKKDQEISRLTDHILLQVQEIDSMKSSKFWKLRNLYVNLRKRLGY